MRWFKKTERELGWWRDYRKRYTLITYGCAAATGGTAMAGLITHNPAWLALTALCASILTLMHIGRSQ
jgi:hypothetical protein